MPIQKWGNDLGRVYGPGKSETFNTAGLLDPNQTFSNSSFGTTSPNPWSINTSTDNLLADYTMPDELRGTFADYDPSKEQFIQQGYRQQIKGIQNSLLGMTNQFRGNMAGQGFNKAGMNNMYNTMQYGRLQQQGGLLGLNRNQSIFDVRQAHVTEQQNQLANLIGSDANIQLTAETDWYKAGFSSKDEYDQYLADQRANDDDPFNFEHVGYVPTQVTTPEDPFDWG